MPGYGDPVHLAIALFVLLVILAIARFATGFLAHVAVLLGIIAGAALAVLLGKMSFTDVAAAPVVAVVEPFHFGLPMLDPVGALTMCLVLIVTMIESIGGFLAVSEMTGRPLQQGDLVRGLRADGLGAIVGGVFNTFPYTTFSQNVGLVGMTGIRSRFVCVAAGIILVILSLVPKLAALFEAVPVFVLGGAGLVMFGMVAATGIRILSGVDFKTNRHNAMIVAVSIGVGMIPLLAPNFKQWMPHAIHSLVESGILLASVCAVLLNLFLNGAKHDEAAIVAAAKQAEAH
jgi:NCS2 family nucleobase:cation symporter-2